LDYGTIHHLRANDTGHPASRRTGQTARRQLFKLILWLEQVFFGVFKGFLGKIWALRATTITRKTIEQNHRTNDKEKRECQTLCEEQAKLSRTWGCWGSRCRWRA